MDEASMDEAFLRKCEADIRRVAAKLNSQGQVQALVLMRVDASPLFNWANGLPWYERPAQELGLYILPISVPETTPQGETLVTYLLLSKKAELTQEDLWEVFAKNTKIPPSYYVKPLVG